MASTKHVQHLQDQSTKDSIEGNVTDELVNIREPEITFLNNFIQYSKFLYTTWGNLILSIPYLIFTPLTLISSILFASVSSFVMFILLFVCTLFNQRWARKIYYKYNDVSLVNAPYPKIFEGLTEDIKNAAYETLSSSTQRSNANKSVFDLEVSKLLLCVSALVYEAPKPSYGFEGVPSNAYPSAAFPAGGESYERQAGHKKAERARRAVELATSHIAGIALEHLGLEVEPLSVLSTQTSSLATAFWKPKENFIILAFKGTDPTEFSEWLIDFTNTYSDQVDYLKGYKGVHKGFYDQIFTPPTRGRERGVLPYDSICKGVKKIAEALQADVPLDQRKPVNLFVTGHSLGCGLASVFFARAQARPQDFGINDQTNKNLVVVRDAYLFAAPIFGDYDSKVAFNQACRGKGYDKPSIIWRVTNRQDIVAVGLPHGGDHQTIGNQFGQRGNLLNFAHIGQEIKLKPFKMTRKIGKMKSKPVLSQFGPGTLLSPNSRVEIYSALGRGIGPKIKLAWYYNLAERLPIVGNFVSHGTSFYFRKLMEIGATVEKETLPPAKHGWL